MKELNTFREVEFGLLYLVTEGTTPYYCIFGEWGHDDSLEEDPDEALMTLHKVHYHGTYDWDEMAPALIPPGISYWGWKYNDGEPMGFNDSHGAVYTLIETLEDIPDKTVIPYLEENGMLDHLKKGIKELTDEELWGKEDCKQ